MIFFNWIKGEFKLIIDGFYIRIISWFLVLIEVLKGYLNWYFMCFIM